ncbi:endo alpha-1,4 polygalactosaminidase [Alcanivorax sp. DP30]|uniref:endo alpha-1,4 polygalactosaminidase n=1 Tax=Alcanivorax sp. DP30 TaxID=2606217 RepID=UPI00136AC151|nr:endo alpha-1,4 polygalactosaminidase [Alcanivorax sp. DP30]MZR62339.1 endo alpha-1,4 polygalactosaminidase [Alcanivorax sp. DP30]
MNNLGLLGTLLSSLIHPSDGEVPQPTTDWYQPSIDTRWQIQLQGSLNTGYPTELYVLDLFDTPESVIHDIQASGRRVICYFSAGTYENWREDRTRFRAAEKGRALGDWPGERWLDIRSQNVRHIMTDRIELAARKGCDGVDPDNVDGYTNNTGFTLTYKNQLDYNRFLADQAHGKGLAISLKNDLEQVEDLVSHMDFAINESCHQWQECHLLQPFIDAGKPVFHIDYLHANDPVARTRLCQTMNQQSFRSLTLPRALDDSYRFSCDP